MPLYEYLCKNCNRSFELQHKMSDPLPTKGPECPAANCTLERQICAVAGVIKSPNPFATRSGAPLPKENTNSPIQSEKKHECGSGCAMHNLT